MFELYNKVGTRQYMRLLKGFPYMMCLQERKLQGFCGQFKKYKMSYDQIHNIVTKSGGLMASRVQNLTGLFDNMKRIGITSK
jgi:hypothetical protein